MTLVAVGGLAFNVICAYLLHGDHAHDLNMRGDWLHVMGDLLGSVVAIVAGVLILAFSWTWTDAVGSFLISLIIIFGAWNLIRESVNVLLESTPAHINLASVEQTILNTENVEDVHDLHIWTISSGIVALSAHVRHSDTIAQSELLKKLRDKLHDRFSIDHLTIQLEIFADEETHNCFSGVNCFDSEIRVKTLASHR